MKTWEVVIKMNVKLNKPHILSVAAPEIEVLGAVAHQEVGGPSGVQRQSPWGVSAAKQTGVWERSLQKVSGFSYVEFSCFDWFLYINGLTDVLCVKKIIVMLCTGRAAAPPRPLLAVPNVTAHPSTASVPSSYYSMWHSNHLCNLKG